MITMAILPNPFTIPHVDAANPLDPNSMTGTRFRHRSAEQVTGYSYLGSKGGDTLGDPPRSLSPRRGTRSSRARSMCADDREEEDHEERSEEA